MCQTMRKLWPVQFCLISDGRRCDALAAARGPWQGTCHALDPGTTTLLPLLLLLLRLQLLAQCPDL